MVNYATYANGTNFYIEINITSTDGNVKVLKGNGGIGLYLSV